MYGNIRFNFILFTNYSKNPFYTETYIFVSKIDENNTDDYIEEIITKSMLLENFLMIKKKGLTKNV
tara:strand:+ start:376 stop:573 length:198 start_codon:yes stop_codon:yes gene_type:complete